jgi:hypothetical protein
MRSPRSRSDLLPSNEEPAERAELAETISNAEAAENAENFS